MRFGLVLSVLAVTGVILTGCSTATTSVEPVVAAVGDRVAVTYNLRWDGGDVFATNDETVTISAEGTDFVTAGLADMMTAGKGLLGELLVGVSVGDVLTGVLLPKDTGMASYHDRYKVKKIAGNVFTLKGLEPVMGGLYEAVNAVGVVTAVNGQGDALEATVDFNPKHTFWGIAYDIVIEEVEKKEEDAKH